MYTNFSAAAECFPLTAEKDPSTFLFRHRSTMCLVMSINHRSLISFDVTLQFAVGGCSVVRSPNATAIMNELSLDKQALVASAKSFARARGVDWVSPSS